MFMYCMAVFLYVAIIYDYHMAIICLRNMTLFLYLHHVLYDYIIWLYHMFMYCMAVFLHVAIIYDYHVSQL